MSAEIERVSLELARKQWSTLRACFAIGGYEIARLTGGAGFRVSRWNWSLDLPDLASVLAFGERAGIEMPREAPA